MRRPISHPNTLEISVQLVDPTNFFMFSNLRDFGTYFYFSRRLWETKPESDKLLLVDIQRCIPATNQYLMRNYKYARYVERVFTRNRDFACSDSTFRDPQVLTLLECREDERKRAKKKRAIHPPCLLRFLPHHRVVAARGGIPSVRLRHHRSWLYREVSPLASALVNTLHRYRQDRWEVRERSLSLLMNYRACESQFHSSYPAVVSCGENVTWTSSTHGGGMQR